MGFRAVTTWRFARLLNNVTQYRQTRIMETRVRTILRRHARSAGDYLCVRNVGQRSTFNKISSDSKASCTFNERRFVRLRRN